MELQNKRVLITGSSRGIGLACAQRFLDEGALVTLNGRDAKRVKDTAEALGPQCFSSPGDLSSAAGCEQVVDTAVAAMGGLDVLINNAGLFPIASMEDTDEETFDNTMNASVKSAYFTSRAALPALREGGGVILNHGSIAGLIGLANISAYCTAKGALVHLTKAMAMELAPDIRVNCVCPTSVENEMGLSSFQRAEDPAAAQAAFIANSKMQRMATENDVVEAFLFLASPRAAFMTGVALPVDGGKSAGV